MSFIPRETALQLLTQLRPIASERLMVGMEAALGLREPAFEHADQRPTTFYVPGLSASAWHPKTIFDWTAKLEQAYPTILAELQDLRQTNEFQNYVQPQARIHEGHWKTLYLYLGTNRYDRNCTRCPETMKIIDAIPRRTASVMFSALTPGSVIHPHYGPTNIKLRCHLGLSGTEGSSFEVGSETRPWREGECFVFDDSYLHAAYNRGEHTRVVLIVDVWHPDLTDQEVALLERLSEFLPDTHQNLVDEEYRKAAAKDGAADVNEWWV